MQNARNPGQLETGVGKCRFVDLSFEDCVRSRAHGEVIGVLKTYDWLLRLVHVDQRVRRYMFQGQELV